MRNRERNQVTSNADTTPVTTDPNIASTTAELKGKYALPAQTPPEANKYKGNRLGHLPILVGAGALTAAIAAGGYFATKSGESNPAPDRNRDPVATAPATPGETEVAEPTVEFGISAAEVNGDMEKFVSTYYEQFNSFVISGATEEAATANERFTMDDDEYVDMISTPINEEFFNNLFVEDWQSNPTLASYVQSVAAVAHDTRNIRLFTYSGGTEDIEPYVREVITDSITIDPYDPAKVNVEWHEQDNSDLNRGEDFYDGGFDPNTITGSNTLTTVIENGQIKISDISY